jgi:hypothetical protein
LIDFRKNFWLAPILIAIIALISLLSPAAYRTFNDGGIYFWLWALNISTDTGYLWFNTDALALFGAIAETLVIIIAMLILIYTGISIKREKKNQKIIKIFLLISGTLLILAPLGYIIGSMFYQTDFWGTYSPSFGIIGPFIAAAIAFITIFLYKKT